MVSRLLQTLVWILLDIKPCLRTTGGVNHLARVTPGFCVHNTPFVEGKTDEECGQ